jgi:hypothetical protein
MGDATTLDELKQLLSNLAADVTAIKADQSRLHVAVNKVQSNILADGSSSTSRGRAVDTADGSSPVASHKLRFPKYDGASDPLAWLHRCDQFFRAAKTLEEEKVWYAAFHLKDDAQQWYYRVELNQGVPTWERFVDLVSRRFGPPTRSNPLCELIKLQHVGSVAEYQYQSLKHLARCDGVMEQQQIAIYTTGLGDPLRIDVELQRPVTLEDAMALSRAYERRNAPVELPPLAGRTMSRPPARSASSAPLPVTPAPTPTLPPAATPGAPQRQRQPPSHRFTRLSAEEMAQRREVELCYNWPTKFSEEHMKECTMKGIYLLEIDDNGPADDQDADVSSRHHGDFFLHDDASRRHAGEHPHPRASGLGVHALLRRHGHCASPRSRAPSAPWPHRRRHQ